MAVYEWPDLKGYREMVLADRPVAYWRLGEQSGTTARDSSPFSRHGTYTGGVTLGQPGALRQDGDTAALFDGAGGRVAVGDVLDFPGTQPFSMECWVFPLSLPSSWHYALVSKWGTDSGATRGYMLFIRNSPTAGQLSFTRYTNGSTLKTVTAPSVLPVGAWSYLVGTYDGASMRLYVNGVEVASTAATNALTDTALNLTLGATPGGGSPLHGLLDEVAIYGYALPPERIRAHFETAKGTGVITEEQVAAVLQGREGKRRWRSTLWAAGDDGRLQEPFPPGAVRGVTLSMNNFRDHPWELQVTTRAVPDLVDIFHGHVALTLDLDMTGDWVRFRFGPFHAREVQQEYRERDTFWTFTARDHTMHLAESGPDAPVYYAAGTNVLSAVRQVIITQAGLPASAIQLPVDNVVLATDFFRDPFSEGDRYSWLQLINELLTAGGFAALSVTARGQLTTVRASALASLEPSVLYGDRAMLRSRPVSIEPDFTRFANVVVVIGQDLQQSNPPVAVARNLNPASPASVPAYGPVSKIIRASNVVDAQAAEALAQAELAKASAFYQRSRIETFPDPRRDVREAYRLHVRQADSTMVVDSVWRVTGWSLSINERGVPGVMTHEISRTEVPAL